MKIHGTAHAFGRDVDTDAIIAERYLNVSDPAELAAHCMEDIDSGFVGRVQPGDVVVAGENFGCGSSREHAAIALKAAGIDAVIEVAEMMGSEMHLHMNTSGTEVIAIVPTLNMDIDEMSAGTKLKLKLQTEAMHLFDAETEESLVK